MGGGDRKVREYLSNLPTLKNDPLSIQAMLELAGLEMKENCQIEELTLGEKKILFLIKLVADTSKQYIFQSLFQDMKENEVQSAVRLIVEMSTYMNVILLSSSSEGYEICDRVIQWSGNDGRGHISRSKYGATFGGITARGTCDMITNENKELLAQAVVEGSMPGDNSILLKDDYRDFDGKEKLGETIELSLGEKTIPVTISGFFDGQKTDFASGHGPIGVDGPMMFLSEELFQELIPDVTNFDYSWDIVCDPEKSEKVEKDLKNLVVSHTDIGLDTFEDKVDSYGYMDVAYGVMQVISWFIFLLGVINLINTTLSNQYSHRQENSVLRSIGLAPKQLAQMTVWEGMGYVVSSILLMLAIGLPITLLIWRKFSISAYAGRILPYEFPWLQMGVYVVVLVTVELILSIWTIRRQKKQSLIEQMRAME